MKKSSVLMVVRKCILKYYIFSLNKTKHIVSISRRKEWQGWMKCELLHPLGKSSERVCEEGKFTCPLTLSLQNKTTCTAQHWLKDTSWNPVCEANPGPAGWGSRVKAPPELPFTYHFDSGTGWTLRAYNLYETLLEIIRNTFRLTTTHVFMERCRNK